jgi:hypothetical protein
MNIWMKTVRLLLCVAMVLTLWIAIGWTGVESDPSVKANVSHPFLIVSSSEWTVCLSKSSS